VGHERAHGHAAADGALEGLGHPAVVEAEHVEVQPPPRRVEGLEQGSRAVVGLDEEPRHWFSTMIAEDAGRVGRGTHWAAPTRSPRARGMLGAMLLSGLVECVGRVRATPRKLEKVALLADLLRQTRGRETELAASYLTGTLPQGRIGVGWSTLQAAALSEGSGEGDP
jgi:hypothetical protein